MLSVSKVRSERTLVVLFVVVVVTGVDVVLWGVVVGAVVLTVVVMLSVVCIITVLLETVVGNVVLTVVGSGFWVEVVKISILGLTFPATPLFSWIRSLSSFDSKVTSNLSEPVPLSTKVVHSRIRSDTFKILFFDQSNWLFNDICTYFLHIFY